MFAVLLLVLADSPKIEVVNLCPPKIEVTNLCPAVPEVTAKPTFRTAVNYGRIQSHNCQGCNQQQLVQAGRGPVRGTHWHVCDNCKSQWFH